MVEVETATMNLGRRLTKVIANKVAEIIIRRVNELYAMTDDQAAQVAKRCWGSLGIAFRRDDETGSICCVGMNDYTVPSVKGWGYSWEEAFAMARSQCRSLCSS
jgi:hypothetical protein